MLKCVWCDREFLPDQQAGSFAGQPLGPCCSEKVDRIMRALPDDTVPKMGIKPEPSNE